MVDRLSLEDAQNFLEAVETPGWSGHVPDDALMYLRQAVDEITEWRSEVRPEFEKMREERQALELDREDVEFLANTLGQIPRGLLRGDDARERAIKLHARFREEHALALLADAEAK